MAGVSALLAVPKSVTPQDVPEPWVVPRALRRVAQTDAELSGEARAGRLDVDVRALGSAMRAYGCVDYGGSDKDVVAARRRVADAAQKALARGERAVLELRAFQLESFLREVARWETTGIESDELRELGGAFVPLATRSGWIDQGHVRLDDAVRRALFKRRYNELGLLRGATFELSLDEQRALYRFLLRFPPVDEGPPEASFRRPDTDIRIALAADTYRLHKIDELSRVDPTYPRELARGVVLYRLRRFALAVEAFRRHLDKHPEGPDTLRARNYLRAALERARED